MRIPHSLVVSFPRQSQLVHLNNYHVGFSLERLVYDLNFQVGQIYVVEYAISSCMKIEKQILYAGYHFRITLQTVLTHYSFARCLVFKTVSVVNEVK